jgi:hypothetical protein
MAAPTERDVKQIADFLRRPNRKSEQRGEDLMIAAWLKDWVKDQPLDVIADFLEENRKARARGGQSKRQYRKGNTAWRWWAINRRIARWRRAYQARPELCRRGRLAAKRPHQPRGALEWALAHVADETGYAVKTIETNWNKYGDFGR